MSFWPLLWTVTFVASLLLFLFVALKVTIGGAADLKAMFRSLSKE